MIGIGTLPRRDGVIIGRWRVRHDSEDFTAGLGNVTFERGVSTAPVTGRPLQRLIAAMGGQLTVEPWDAKAEAELIAQLSADDVERLRTEGVLRPKPSKPKTKT